MKSMPFLVTDSPYSLTGPVLYGYANQQKVRVMTRVAKARVFMNGRSQHVTIPAEFRFRSTQVTVRRDPSTGDLILSEVPDIQEIFSALDAAKIPADFMSEADRDRLPAQERQALDDL
jgi:antitoxin VapB